MSAYVIVHATINDADKFKEYGEAAGPVVESYGGKVISRGPSELLSGQHDYKVTVIIEFPSADKAREWYTSQEYQKLVPNRNDAIDSVFILRGD
jgi:uncharacterized protein (DUF1330 family)